MKNTIFTRIQSIALVLLLIITIILQLKYTIIEKQLSASKNNEKAYNIENISLSEKNIAFKFTIDQLTYINDSLVTEVNSLRKDLKIKDSNVKQLQYLLSEAQKKDTIVFRDTIFKDPSLNIDTIIGDYWYTLNIGMQYPNTLSVAPTFKSEKYIIAHSSKEYINPPKKCFIKRLFQKKHKIVEVNVIEKNPYIKNTQQKFIEIVK